MLESSLNLFFLFLSGPGSDKPLESTFSTLRSGQLSHQQFFYLVSRERLTRITRPNGLMPAWIMMTMDKVNRSNKIIKSSKRH